MPILDLPRGPINYIRAGRGPSVLLIQGAGVVGEGWRPQIDELADRFDLLAFDNRGIGASARGSGPLTIASMAADALAVADAAGFDRFDVAGHSMGGLIAQEVALTAPRRVRSLALLCTFARGAQASKLTPASLVIAIRTRAGTASMRRRAFSELILPAAYLASVDRDRLERELSTLFGHDLAEQPPIVAEQLKAMSSYDATGRLAALAAIPTLVAAAAQDRIARPAYGRELAAAIPGAGYVEFADAGHALPIQCPAPVNALLARHFAGSAKTG